MTHADLARSAIESAASELSARRAIDQWLGAISGRRLEIVGGQLVAWDAGWRCGAAATHAELVRLLDGERERLRRRRQYCCAQREISKHFSVKQMLAREWQASLERVEARLTALENLSPARETDALAESGADSQTGEETE